MEKLFNGERLPGLLQNTPSFCIHYCSYSTEVEMVVEISLYSSQQSMDPSLRIFASKPGITFNLLLLATVVSALNSSKYLGTQSDVLLTCSVRAITFSPIFSARAMTFLIVRFEAE